MALGGGRGIRQAMESQTRWGQNGRVAWAYLFSWFTCIQSAHDRYFELYIDPVVIDFFISNICVSSIVI